MSTIKISADTRVTDLSNVTWNVLQQKLQPHALLAVVLSVISDEEGQIELTDKQLRDFLCKTGVEHAGADFGIVTNTTKNGITISQVSDDELHE